MSQCFVPADILLPEESVPLNPWACIAVDQFTSQPEYWQRAEAQAAGAPSTLHIVLPEAYLGTPQGEQRLPVIRATMEDYLKNVLTRHVNGYVYVERTQMDGTVRQGLVGAVDLESYSYTPGEKLDIRPSENTVISRIPPRLKVRRGAVLETPHVMMLADDEACTVIEPIGRCKHKLPKLYDAELMLGGGNLAGWAVQDPALVVQIDAALAALGDPQAFAKRWPDAAGAPPMTLAVGDGNHSLATAKAYWEELKSTLPEQERADHPARWCLAEVCNVHSPAIEIEPIHRVLFGTDGAAVKAALADFARAVGARLDGDPNADGAQCFTLVDGNGATAYAFNAAPEPLAVGTVERFIGEFLQQHPGVEVDYIHGDQTARGMAGKNAVAFLLPEFRKADLFRGVVLGGVLPRKTFSMGHAEEKRYYNECRSLMPSTGC